MANQSLDCDLETPSTPDDYHQMRSRPSDKNKNMLVVVMDQD